MASAFDNRFNIISHLMALDADTRRKIKDDLHDIGDITHGLDRIISGKSLDNTTLDDFEKLVKQTRLPHPIKGMADAEYCDWYATEFKRLQRVAHTPTGQIQPVMERVSFGRQVGTTTFIIFYAAYMGAVETPITLMVNQGTDIEYILEYSEKMGLDLTTTNIVTRKDDPSAWANEEGQIIMDNVSHDLFYDHKLSDMGRKMIATRQHSNGVLVTEPTQRTIVSYVSI